jgi:hypothetical protein
MSSLETGLPLALREQALLRREAERALVPTGVGEHAQLAKQLARERGSWTRHGDVVRGPRIARHRILATTRIAPRLALELEQNEVAEAAPIELPRGAQTGDAAADDHDGHAHRATRCGRRCAIAQAVPDGGALVDPSAGDARTLSCRVQEAGARELRRDGTPAARCDATGDEEGAARGSGAVVALVVAHVRITTLTRSSRDVTDSPAPTPARSSAPTPAC